MFKEYIIIEQNEKKIKLRHIKTGDHKFVYRSICSSCSQDRGWKRGDKRVAKCKSCAQRTNFLLTLDKTKYINVNFEDSQFYKKLNKGSEMRYKTSCLTCKIDRGYLPISSSHKECRSCARKTVHNSKTSIEKQLIAEKISMTQTGDESFNGFKTPEMDRQRGIFKSKNLSKQAFIRDNYTCQCCKMQGIELHAHHLNGFDNFPEQRFELNNLVTLCALCHDKFHTEYGKGSNTKDQYTSFKSNPPPKKIVHILTGAPASGKSWVGSHLNNFDVIDSDIVPKKKLVDEVNRATTPLLILTIGVSTFMKRNPQYSYVLIVIKEDELTINNRMLLRGGRITNTITRRIKRMVGLAKQADFVGTSQEVLTFLN